MERIRGFSFFSWRFEGWFQSWVRGWGHDITLRSDRLMENPRDPDMGVEPKIGMGPNPPKWMVKIMVPNPMNKWMIWGAHPYFWKYPYVLRIRNFRCNPMTWDGIEPMNPTLRSGFLGSGISSAFHTDFLEAIVVFVFCFTVSIHQDCFFLLVLGLLYIVEDILGTLLITFKKTPRRVKIVKVSIPTGKDRLPTIIFQRAMLVSGTVAPTIMAIQPPPPP